MDPNLIALTRRPSRTLAKAELTHLHREPISLPAADAQHAAYRDALRSAGATVHDLPALDAHADATFVEDTLIALPEAFIACRPGALSRQGEVASVMAALPADRPLVALQAPATLDGGDVLRVGRTLYVGLSTRTNEAAVSALRVLVEPWGYEVRPVPVRGALHLKTAVTTPRAGLWLLNPEWVDERTFSAPDVLAVDPSEPFAGNSLCLGEVVFMQTAHALTAARLAARGLDVRLLDIGEFAKAEAGLSCLSVLLPPPAVATAAA